MTTYPDDTMITLQAEIVDNEKPVVTDPNELMRKGLLSALTEKDVLTREYVLAECGDVKDEMNRLALSTMNKADVDKAIKAYDAKWLKPVDMTRERDIVLLNDRYDHVIKILDKITLGGAMMFGVCVSLLLFFEYLQP